jgi:hypothetical protein
MNSTRIQRFLSISFVIVGSGLLITLNAEAENPEASFSLRLSAGASIPAPLEWHFVGLSNVEVEPRPSFGFGVEYGPLRWVSGSSLLISADLAHTTV